jgi:hypothetical protein
MTDQMRLESPAAMSNRIGFYAAVLMPIITLVTFGLAMIAIPIAGANCPANCIDYPYLDAASQYPRDFLWMYPAILMMLVYLVLMIAIHQSAPAHRQIFSQIGATLASLSALILMLAYFTQFSIIPISLMKGETEGIALLIQYNPHGLFIALEDLGYLLMSFSFIFMVPVFTGTNRLEAAIRWIFLAGFALVLVALVAYSILYGLDIQDRFEVVALSVDWLVLIVNGILLSIMFRRRLREQ